MAGLFHIIQAYGGTHAAETAELCPAFAFTLAKISVSALKAFTAVIEPSPVTACL